MNSQSVNTYLQSFGIKPSQQRLAVMEYLLTHKTHPTAEEIYQHLSPSMPTLSRTTVYNTLRLLSEYGAAIMIDIDERNKRFDGDTSIHGHFLCTECGRIHDIRFNEQNILFDNNIDGHQVRSMQILYKGCCKQCQHKDKKI